MPRKTLCPWSLISFDEVHSGADACFSMGPDAKYFRTGF